SVQNGVLLVVSPDPSAHQRGRLAVVLGREVDEAVVSRAVFASLVERVNSGVHELQPSAAASAPDAVEHAQTGSPVGAEEPVVGHLAPVVDESDAEETTEEWVEPADGGEQGRWADHAEEAPAEEHSWNGASSPEPGPVAEHESVQSPVVHAVAPDAGRIDELG